MGLGSAPRQTVTPPRIVGIVLVRDEDLMIERAVRNAVHFCDEWIFCDHASRDKTPKILERLCGDIPSARLLRINHPKASHEAVKGYAGQKCWIFGLDGDEVYDPFGLARLRARLLSGEFDEWWMILGNVLHVTQLAANHATGHLAPPCRSMTKLYNFQAIDSWDGYCVERLHGGFPMFRDGFSAARRFAMHESTAWEKSDFRCLHLCFQARSSRGDSGNTRPNIMETFGSNRWTEWLSPLRRLRAGWKHERYRRGPEIAVDTLPFFGSDAPQ